MKQCLSLGMLLLIASASIASIGSGDTKTDNGFETDVFLDTSATIDFAVEKEPMVLTLTSGISFTESPLVGKSVSVSTDLALELEKECTRSHEPTCFGYINKQDISALQFG